MKNTIKELGIVTLITLFGLIAATCATFGIGTPLPPPENVRLTQTVGPRSITVTWNAVEGATEYEVQLVGVGRWTTRELTFTTPGGTNIAPDRNYDVRVSANKRAITGEQSPAITIRTSPATPAERLPVPSNVIATANSWNSITVRWGASAGATSYRVTQGSNTWTVTGTSHTITNLNGDTSYSFVVTPLINNDAGTSARAVSVRTPLSPQQQAAAEQRAREQEAAAERQRQAEADEAARITALNNNVNFQRLRGEWNLTAGGENNTLVFPNDPSSDVTFTSFSVSLRGKLQTVTANQVTVGDSRSGFSFNYTLSGNTLTISNFTLRASGFSQASNANNGTYTKR